MKNFAQHITEAPKKDTVVIAFGRMNPPTIGHGVLVDKVLSEASKRNAGHFIFASVSQDPKKNPLTHKQKVEYLKKFFPKAKFPLNKAGDPYSAVLHVCDLGYKNIIMSRVAIRSKTSRTSPSTRAELPSAILRSASIHSIHLR